ncbi:putative porin [Pectinatus haikarae]|uniref:SLH domain-containing protein n=1 Tax=Pectinatus haikarae TaxID=349096 RepID=A0ABT9Y658_9FIRM|nr:putative porin [Pectinatus haikarae]MDQ0202634.1 hypothetical protein [Pectinatus haikarae]
MKKRTLVSMITGALVIGAASTTFAAANPFSDVPADSWAYDAVSKLASDGVVNGFPDGTYKGQQTMTRYEMAQIIAKAMTKTDIDKADKALVDKLAAEFSEELDNLGVRVADLEKKSDNVKWGGRLRYYYRGVKDDSAANKDRTNDTQYELRLEPKAFIGDSGWTANARIRYYSNAASANNGGSTNNGTSDKSDTKIDRIFVEGPLFGSDAKLGKVGTYSDNVFNTGMIIDDSISGAEFNWTFGKDKSNYAKATIGRYDYNSGANVGVSNYAYDGTGDYTSFEFGHKAKDKGISALAGYYSLRNMDSTFSKYAKADSDKTNFWVGGLGYKFDKNIQLFGLYAKSDMDEASNYLGDDQSKAYDITLKYKNADIAKAGSWDIYAAYRYLGQFATIAPTYDISARDTKGWQIGTDFVLSKNILAMVEYYKGKRLSADYSGNDADYNAIYGRVDFFF